MPLHRIALHLSLSVAALVAVHAPAVSQENRGTAEQRMACTPDVFRLCGAMIPDADRITECLRQNTALLSGPCRAVFAPDPGVAPQAALRRRDVAPRYDVQPRYYDPAPRYSAQPGYDGDQGGFYAR